MTQFEQDCMHWRGRLLTGKEAHYCHDWDGLPMDETCEEYSSCGCGPFETKLTDARCKE